MRLDPGADSNKCRQAPAETLPELVQTTELIEVVDHEPADARLGSKLQLVVQLVVAVEAVSLFELLVPVAPAAAQIDLAFT